MGVLNTVRSGLNVLFTPVLYGVVASLALQLSTWEKGDRTQDKLQDNNNPNILKNSDTFDFIVVGGGTAGSVVVNRLSEQYSVLLLEAGGEPNPLVYMPGLAKNLLSRPEVDWTHKTVAQRRACLLSQFKRATWSQGKGLGGSGNLGWMVSLRGHTQDFDNWAKLVEDEEWSYGRLKKWFKRHENFVGNTTDPEAHAQGGEFTIQLPDYRPLAKEFVGAGKELGYPNLDLNGRFTEGFDELFYPSKKGEKLTTYKTFVEPIKRRDNLTIRKFASVTRILLRKEDNSAYGVEFERHGKKYTVYSRREVIISAGAVQSPKLLMLSGIGPEKHLEDIGIKPIVNLPVGRNLQDHLGVFLGPFFIQEPLSFDFDRDVTAKSFFEYGTFGTGPVTSTGFTATALLASSLAHLRGEKDWPDIQLLMHGVSVHQNYAGDMAHAFGLNDEVLKKYYKHATGRHSFHIVISLSRPYARGEVRLASRNPQNPLIIDPKYFEDPWDFDVKTLVEGVKKAVKLVESSKTFLGLGGQFTSEILPGCERQQFKSDDYWECYIRQLSVSMHNPVGTCTMGPVGSPHTVVDSKLRVVNVPQLRVVDASIMPSIVIGGTQQATIAIADKAANDILSFWEKQQNPPKLVVKPTPEQNIAASSREQIFSSSEMFTVKPVQNLQPQSSPAPLFGSKEAVTMPNFLQSFTINPETSQTWQNTLDQLSAFSKQISQFTNPLTTSAPTTTKATTTTTQTTTKSTNKPQFLYFSSPSSSPGPVTPSLGPTYYHTSSEKTTTPLVYVPIIPLPTQQVKISNHSPTPKVTTYRPPHSAESQPEYYREPQPQPTTFRPREHQQFNKSMNTYNIPIIRANYKSMSSTIKPTIQSQPSSVRIYTAQANENEHPRKQILQQHNPNHQIYQKKEPYYRKFVPPKSTTLRYTTPPPTTTTTSTTTTPRPTTTRRTMFEMIHSQVLPQGFNNYVEIPLTRVNYQTYQNTQKPTTTTPPKPSTTKKVKPEPMQIIPAIQLTASALETTTTRYHVPSGMEDFATSNIQAIPQDVLLTGLEPYSLVDVTTATEVPSKEYLTSTVKTPAKQKDAPLYYVVRKKPQQQQHSNNLDPFSDHSDFVKLIQHHQQQQQQQQRYPPPRKQKPSLNPFRHLHRKPNRPPHHHHHRRPPPKNMMNTAQSQRHYPLIALPPSHFAPPQRQQIQHYITTVEDHHGMGSTQIHAVVPNPNHQNQNVGRNIQNKNKPRPGANSGVDDGYDGIITPAIAKEIFDHSVLDQLIPIH